MIRSLNLNEEELMDSLTRLENLSKEAIYGEYTKKIIEEEGGDAVSALMNIFLFLNPATLPLGAVMTAKSATSMTRKGI